MLFADILKSTICRPPGFIGHIGGDDFFACVDAPELEAALEPLNEAAGRFAREATSFYAAEDRERGWILGKDRAGRERRMGLLTVSTAIVALRPGAKLDAESLSEILAELKREAKSAPSKLALRVIDAHAPSPPESGHPGGDGAQRASSGSLGESSTSLALACPVFTPSLISAY